MAPVQPVRPWLYWFLREKKASLEFQSNTHSHTRPTCKMWAGLMCAKFSVACLLMMANFKKEARSNLLTNPHHTFQHQEFGKTAPVRQLFQAAWFQLLQMASLAVVTTGRTGVPEQVISAHLIFLGEHTPRLLQLVLLGCFHIHLSTDCLTRLK